MLSCPLILMIVVHVKLSSSQFKKCLCNAKFGNIVVGTKIFKSCKIKLFPLIIFCELLLSGSIFCSYPKENFPKEKKLTAETLFKAAFLETRLHQIDAVQSVLKFQNYEKQYEIIDKALSKIYEVVSSSKVIVENSNYIPGFALPTNVSISDALGKIIDNTAMFGEFRLKLADITERIMKNHPDWLILMKWAIGFSNSTGIFDLKTVQMINLLCQEMYLIPREDNFVNPYRKLETKVKREDSIVVSKQKKSKSKKGPRMTKIKSTEL